MKRPTTPIRDKSILSYIEYLEDRLSKYEKSPYVKTYLTLINQLNDFNDQLTILPSVQVMIDGIETKVTPGRIDLFGTKDEKEFERGFKYMVEVSKLLENIDNVRKKMTAEEKDEVKKLLVKDEGVEEFISENGHK